MRKLLYYQRKFDPCRAPDLGAPFVVGSFDGTVLHGSHIAREGPAGFLVVHGLLAHHRAPGLYEFAKSISRFGPTWAFDLRGHGLSGGSSTLGHKEAWDVAAALSFIRRTSDLPIAVVGFSMGAAAAVRAAALFEPAEAVVSVSGPARWHENRRWAARRTALIWKIPGGITAARLATGVRLEPAWYDKESEEPAEVAFKLAPSPLLVVHGSEDEFFSPLEAEGLAQAAHDPKELWMLEGGGHAEGLFMEPAMPVDPTRVDNFADGIVSRLRGLSPIF